MDVLVRKLSQAIIETLLEISDFIGILKVEPWRRRGPPHTTLPVHWTLDIGNPSLGRVLNLG